MLLIDGIKLFADSGHNPTEFGFRTLILLNGRFQFKCGIDEDVCNFVNVLTQVQASLTFCTIFTLSLHYLCTE